MYEDEPPNPADQQLIKWAKVMMICSGLWNGPIGTHRMVEKLHKIYGRFIRYSFFALVLFLHLECLRLVVKGYNREIVIGSFSVVVSVTKILFKTVVFMRYPLLDVVNEIVRKERQVWASGCEEIQALYRKKIKFVKRTVLMLLVLSTITVMTLQVSGAVATLKIKRYNVMNNASLESHFMYQTVFPLNRINHLNWLFSTEILWGWIGLLYSSITQLIFITILAYAAIQLQILQVHFRDLMGSTVELFPAHAEVLQGALKLREHMVTHKIIIRFINQFNQTTKYMIMMDFLFSSLDIASVSLSISQVGGSYVPQSCLEK
ncbi:uncharacterized protein [Euwallacea fornicatus]|uniref:uncharacterized protein n=1 Tax=Euwallacea fornicatus TaxID=995702 RepID=UPI00338DDF27